MKPGFSRNKTESETIGKEVAKLLGELDVVDKVLLASFDPFKILAAKRENSSLAIGTFYNGKMWENDTADDLKSEFTDLPYLEQCVEAAPNGTKFMEFIFKNGALLKSTEGTFAVMDYKIFNNDTFKIFKDNYNEDLSFGAFIIDNLALSDELRKQHEGYLDLLIQNNASCLITDNVPRLLKKLGRSPEENKESPPKGFANKISPTILVLFAFVPFVSSL